MDSCHAPGLTDLIMKNGEIIWIGHYGFSNIEQQLPPNDSTSWDAGSIAKTVTAVAAMKAWEDGHYGLDDDINDYLQFSVTNTHYPDDSITQLMLLTHTSSIDQFSMTQCISYNGDPAIPLDTALYNYLNTAGYWYAPGHYMMYPPGDYCKYTNAGIGLAGYFTQVATGDSLPLYCRQHIFEPLGMDHTSWWYSELDTNNVAIQYDYNGVQYVRCYSGRVSHSCYPAGQLKFSAIDLSRFLLAFMQYGRLDTVRILDSTTVALMRTIQDTVVHGQFVCPIGITWWCWHSPSTGSPVWGHAGRDWGASAVMAYYESLDIGVVILSNGEINSLTHLLAGMVPTLVHWAMQYGIAENTIEPANIVTLDVAPNPFTNITNIRYTIPELRNSNFEMRKPTLRIYDASGRLVKSFPNTPYALRNTLSWDGRDDQNRMLGSGVYFVKLGSGNFTETKKVLLVR
jgi:CubicO group peptidase (beta-lactamase class C family)